MLLHTQKRIRHIKSMYCLKFRVHGGDPNLQIHRTITDPLAEFFSMPLQNFYCVKKMIGAIA